LSESNYLRPDVLQEIKRLNAVTVYILGGKGAISEGVERELKANNLEVIRIQGYDAMRQPPGSLPGLWSQAPKLSWPPAKISPML
jgi:hypothetical protein